jgi:hypothetical protein
MRAMRSPRPSGACRSLSAWNAMECENGLEKSELFCVSRGWVGRRQGGASTLFVSSEDFLGAVGVDMCRQKRQLPSSRPHWLRIGVVSSEVAQRAQRVCTHQHIRTNRGLGEWRACRLRRGIAARLTIRDHDVKVEPSEGIQSRAARCLPMHPQHSFASSVAIARSADTQTASPSSCTHSSRSRTKGCLCNPTNTSTSYLLREASEEGVVEPCVLAWQPVPKRPV